MENIAFGIEFERLKSLATEKRDDEKLQLKDFGVKIFFFFLKKKKNQIPFGIITIFDLDFS